MIEIKFSGTSAENIARQMASLLEKLEWKEGQKHGERKSRKTSDRGVRGVEENERE